MAFASVTAREEEKAARPATQRVYAEAAPGYSKPLTDAERAVLFGPGATRT